MKEGIRRVVLDGDVTIDATRKLMPFEPLVIVWTIGKEKIKPAHIDLAISKIMDIPEEMLFINQKSIDS